MRCYTLKIKVKSIQKGKAAFYEGSDQLTNQDSERSQQQRTLHGQSKKTQEATILRAHGI